MCTTTVGARLPIRLAAIFGALVRCYVGRPNRPSSEPITSTSTGERRTYRIFPAGQFGVMLRASQGRLRCAGQATTT